MAVRVAMNSVEATVHFSVVVGASTEEVEE